MIEALKSRATSGYSVVARKHIFGVNNELKLKEVEWFSITWDPEKSNVWLRGKAKFNWVKVRIRSTKFSLVFSIEASQSIKENTLVLKGESLDLSNIPGELDKRLVKNINFKFPLPECLQNGEPKLTNIQLKKNSNSIKLGVSVLNDAVLGIVFCFANNRN